MGGAIIEMLFYRKFSNYTIFSNRGPKLISILIQEIWFGSIEPDRRYVCVCRNKPYDLFNLQCPLLAAELTGTDNAIKPSKIGSQSNIQ